MKTKQCTTCKKVKPFSEFHKRKLGIFGLVSWCNSCVSIKNKVYHQSGRYSIASKKYRDNHPWWKTWNHVHGRCNNPNNVSCKYYGGKGVQLKMSVKDFEYLWFRDKAYLMKKPSISRINETDPKKFHYSKENCLYEEQSKNDARRKGRK